MKGFLHAMPKAELHSHLDGCLRPATIIKFCKQLSIPLPTYDVEKFSEIMFKDRYEDLVDLLKLFDLFLKLMKTPEAVEEIAYEFARDYIDDNVFYAEVRFAPQFHICAGMRTAEEVLKVVNSGFKRAADEYNSSAEVVSHQKPTFKYGILCCMMRTIGKGASEYYDHTLEVFEHMGNKAGKVHAGMELVMAAIVARDTLHIPVVGIDLAGGEYGNPCEDFAEAFALARYRMFNVTIHAGEADGPDSIRNALALGAQRIGHGLHMFDKEMMRKDHPEDAERIVDALTQKRTGVEVCITSNMQTCGGLKTVRDHPLGRMLKSGICVCMACDNKAISKTDLTKEFGLAVAAFNLQPAEIKKLAMNSYEKAFFPGTYLEKLAYLKEIELYYDKIAAKFIKSQ